MVRAAVVFYSRVIVGGNFLSSVEDKKPLHYLAEFDGNSFESVGLGVDGPVNTILPFGSQLLFGGTFSIAFNNGNSVQCGGIAAWNRQ